MKTPPILDWLFVSLPGSSDEESEENFPFETISSAVEKLQTLVCNEWIYQPNETFDLKRKSIGFDDPFISSKGEKNSLKYICSEVIKNMKEIVRESEIKEDYLEQFHSFQVICSELKRHSDNLFEE